MANECPSQDALTTLLNDQPADLLLERHVAGCERCQHRLDVMTSLPVLSLDRGLHPDWTSTRSHSLVRNLEAAIADASTSLRTEASVERVLAIEGYDILERIGAGGSAEVFKAFHRQLRRVVAIKLSNARSRPEDLDRFRREAEALAGLRHPGIVQIYETGQAQGRVFMALEFESGGSLSKFLQGKPQNPVETARFIAAAASAVHAAHREGLIHRDLKPGNLLLHPLDGTTAQDGLAAFTPKVTDFGLVKRLTDESALTASRDVLGTPSYMAPEQVAGGHHRLGPATDVYALGAVLYEMLTGRPPFRAATAIDTVVQVRFDDPVPPQRLTPFLPRDLNTIVLKCLEKDPAHRYASAAALEDDLNRFLEHRPVMARPMGWPVRGWRWVRRNPRVAALTGVIALLLLTLAVFGPLMAYRQATLRENAEQAEARALAQRDRADRNLKSASEAIWQSLLVRFSEAERVGQPLPLDVQRSLIESTIPYLEKAQASDPDLPHFRERWGIAMYLRGRIALQRGDLDAATSDLKLAAVKLDRLANDLPDNEQAQIYAVYCQLELARLARLNEPDKAERLTRETLQRFERVATLFPNSVAALDGVIQTATLLGDVLEAQPGRKRDAIAPLTRALEVWQRFQPITGMDERLLISRSTARLRLAQLLRDCAQSEKAEEFLQKTVEELRRPGSSDKASLELMSLRAKALAALAELLCECQRKADAKPLAAEAVRMLEGLSLLNPDNENLRKRLDQYRSLQQRASLK